MFLLVFFVILVTFELKQKMSSEYDYNNMPRQELKSLQVKNKPNAKKLCLWA